MSTTPNGPVRWLQGESGVAARLVPVTVDDLILAAPGPHPASLWAGASWIRLLSTLVESPGQLTIGFPGRRQIGLALVQGLGQLDVALLELRDRSLKLLDVGGSTKARLAPGLLAQLRRQAPLQLLNSCGQADGAGLRVREIGLE
ncbi:hypothetical protein [Streptomyces mirabilis]|uniref:hypothetical protein n=1 Tax=Streptomyces mirabilis TaxID=68239 RepID=UPI0036DFA403